VTYRKQYITV